MKQVTLEIFKNSEFWGDNSNYKKNALAWNK